jgi:hypothetical protein
MLYWAVIILRFIIKEKRKRFLLLAHPSIRTWWGGIYNYAKPN